MNKSKPVMSAWEITLKNGHKIQFRHIGDEVETVQARIDEKWEDIIRFSGKLDVQA